MSKTQIPHSWGFNDWPSDVFPQSPARAKQLFRAHKDDLIRQGAVARVGRTIVFLGDRYTRFLEKQTSRVPGFHIAPNAAADATTP